MLWPWRIFSPGCARHSGPRGGRGRTLAGGQKCVFPASASQPWKAAMLMLLMSLPWPAADERES